MNWYQQEKEKVFNSLESSPEGLSGEAVTERRERYGPNALEEKKKQPAWMLFLGQFKDFMIVILMAAAVISGIVGELVDTVIILIIVLLNAIVGFVQEYKSEKAMEALKKLATPHTNVVRDGKVANISSDELVPGDVVMLEAGVLVPADLRLFEAHSLRVEESSLTGESVPVDKTTDVIDKEELPLGDQFNLAFKTTQVINGRGKGVVVGTGMKTEIGKIASMLQEDGTVTPLQKRMADFGKKLSYLIIIICIVLLGVGLLRGEDPMTMLLLSISLAVAAIPEALPALITVALAKGAKRLVKKNALIRKLPAVETLGSVTYICSDKTGTLTVNKMKVVEVSPYDTELTLSDKMPLLETVMSLNHDVNQSGKDELIGDPTEVALVDHVLQQFSREDVDAITAQFPREAELPFDSVRKCMTTIHAYEGKFVAVSKGAVEYIITILKSGEGQEQILEEADQLASGGIRVLAYSYRILDRLPDQLSTETVEKDMEFIGLAGMIDPPRAEAVDAIRECKTAGIRPVMITGDHKATAAAIAKEIGILTEGDDVVDGSELSRMSEEELAERVEKITVYARVSPEQKLKIVKALQLKEHFVAMTGDGVNDAPSLKSANIGIAMGITGTDVSKEAAHMILLDDNFATIIKAVKEGRRIFDNIRKFVKYIMTCNSAEIWTIFMAPLLGLPIPLLPIHILWINLVTDGLPGLALSAEKAEHDIMKRPPRKTNESLFAGGNGYHIVWVGILMAAVTLGIQAWAVNNENAHWQTMVFTVLSLAQLGHVFAIRSDHEFIYRKGIFTNKPLLGAIVLTFMLQLAVIYIPFANDIFRTQPLSLEELLICIGLSAVVFHAVELEKLVKRGIRKRRNHPAEPNK